MRLATQRGATATTTSALAAEFVGTLWRLAIVVGSGVMGERLASSNDGIALLANAAAPRVVSTC